MERTQYKFHTSILVGVLDNFVFTHGNKMVTQNMKWNVFKIMNHVVLR